MNLQYEIEKGYVKKRKTKQNKVNTEKNICSGYQ